MKLKNSILAGCTALVVATSCTQRAVEKQTWVEKAIENAHAQIGLEIDTIESSGRFLNPVTQFCLLLWLCGLAERLFPRQCMVFV